MSQAEDKGTYVDEFGIRLNIRKATLRLLRAERTANHIMSSIAFSTADHGARSVRVV